MRYRVDHVQDVYDVAMQKEAATPTVASRWMDSKSPALRRLGHIYAKAVTSKSFERATRDVTDSVLQGHTNAGVDFALATAKGRVIQGLLEKAQSMAPKPVQKVTKGLPALVTSTTRNWAGPSVAGGLLPVLSSMV